MPKPDKDRRPQFSQDREFKVLLEDIYHQFKIFGEGMQSFDRRLGNIEHRLENVERDVAFIKLVLPTVATKDDLKQLEKRLIALESAN